MFDWIRKQIANIQEKKNQKKEAKRLKKESKKEAKRQDKEAKRQKKEAKKLGKLAKKKPDVHFEERDYLYDWNRDHPEEFLDLRLRTIEDEMATQMSSAAFQVDETAWVDSHVVGELSGTVDRLAGGDCFKDKDKSGDPVILVEADFSAFKVDTADNLVRMTRSASLPVLGGIAVDDPIHVVRNHRRFKQRRCDMAADPAFLKDINFVLKRND